METKQSNVVGLFKPRDVRPVGNLEAMASTWITHLSKTGYADNTVNAYRRDLERLVGYCHTVGIQHAQHVTGPLLDDFVQALTLGQNISPRTAQRALECIRSFYKWAIRRGAMAKNPVFDASPIRFADHRVIAPEESLILRMIEKIPQQTNEGIRDRAFFYLMYCSGSRVTALCNLDMWDPINPPQSTVTPGGIVHVLTKGGNVHETVADKTALAYLQAWMAVRHRMERYVKCPALFITNRGTRITRYGVHESIKRYANAVGARSIMSSHKLRHRRGGEIIEKLGIREAQLLLGHKDVRTTLNVYGHFAAEQVRHKVLTQCPVGGA